MQLKVGGWGVGGCGSGGLLKCYAPGGIKRRLKALGVTDALSRGGGGDTVFSTAAPTGVGFTPTGFPPARHERGYLSESRAAARISAENS